MNGVGEDNAGKFLPRVAPIDQFGAGGFRFAGMSHLGSLMVLPSGMRAWRPVAAADIASQDLAGLVAERAAFDFLIIGTGDKMERLPPAVLSFLKAQGIGHEAMATPAAVHVYNVVVAEGRRVAATLIAIGQGNG